MIEREYNDEALKLPQPGRMNHGKVHDVPRNIADAVSIATAAHDRNAGIMHRLPIEDSIGEHIGKAGPLPRAGYPAAVMLLRKSQSRSVFRMRSGKIAEEVMCALTEAAAWHPHSRSLLRCCGKHDSSCSNSMQI